MTWEYQTIKIKMKAGWSGPELNQKEFDTVLNEQGVNNWDLADTINAQYMGQTTEVLLIFKRPRH